MPKRRMANWIAELPKVPSTAGVDQSSFAADILPAATPHILKGLVAHWPAIEAGRSSAADFSAYLKGYATEQPATAFRADAAENGRFFYTDDFKAFNHARAQMPLAAVLDHILEEGQKQTPDSVYAGAVPIKTHLTDFDNTNGLPLLDSQTEMLVSLWVGNKTRIPAHWDLPHNIAAVVRGKRRFVIFPPDCLPDLYVGPLDVTIAGQPASCVDLHQPDLERFPKFAAAMKRAVVADLEPGDALFLPSMWWHHVEADEDLGAMVNYWWREGPQHLTTPMDTLMHALLTLRDLPAGERAIWRQHFDHYIFGADGQELAHLPVHAQGVFGPMTQTLFGRLRAFLAQRLGGRIQ